MRIVVCLLVVFINICPAFAGLTNQLANHSSPYLAMHGKDPVHWQEWNEKSLALARRANKLIFVSSGYFSCHWCHVMHRESYQNKTIAEFLNREFIPVKVDRELDPALDARLIEFVERTRGHAGWPLNVFVTPEGYPVAGLTYAPPASFLKILQRMNLRWKNDQKYLKSLAKQATEELVSPQVANNSDIPSGIGEAYVQALTDQALAITDEIEGGFGAKTKFPHAPQLQVLLDIYQVNGDARLAKLLRLSLDQMAAKGLYDHVGGGFFRYTVDPRWQVPHFEKMLYTNALLASLYIRAAKVFSHPPYAQIGRETLDFMLNELSGKQGALIASLSAVDADNVEGGYYLWNVEVLKRLLTADEMQVAEILWGLKSSPQHEHGHHLQQSMSTTKAAALLKRDEREIVQQLKQIRNKLLQARKQRHIPRDHKRLAAWNGLALSAFVQGAGMQNGHRYYQAAEHIQKYLTTSLWDGQQLYRAKGIKGPSVDATLEDYAYVSKGLYDWVQLTNTTDDMVLLSNLLNQAWRLFYGKQGWQLAQHMLLRYGVGQTLISDGPMPSSSAVLADTTLRYALQKKDKILKALVLKALNVGHEQIAREPFWYATHVAAIARYQRGVEKHKN